MKLFSSLALSVLTLFQMNSSFGYMVYPVIRASGQALSVYCDAKTETACTELCKNSAYCEIQESYCRNCAGTQNLKLKRIFDAIGTSLVATEESRMNLLEIIQKGHFTSLHSITIYNYSGQYDGEQARAQFRYLCPNLPMDSLNLGILLLSLNPKNNSVEGVLGAICPDPMTGQATFHSTNSRWQIP